MLITGKARLFPDIVAVSVVLGALIIFQLILLFVTGWLSCLLRRGVDRAAEAFEKRDE